MEQNGVQKQISMREIQQCDSRGFMKRYLIPYPKINSWWIKILIKKKETHVTFENIDEYLPNLGTRKTQKPRLGGHKTPNSPHIWKHKNVKLLYSKDASW